MNKWIPNKPWPIIPLGRTLKKSEKMRMLLENNKTLEKFDKNSTYKYVNDVSGLGPALILNNIHNTFKMSRCVEIQQEIDKLTKEYNELSCN